MHWIISCTGLVFLFVYYLIERNEIFNTFGWLGVFLGALLWWRNEKELASADTGRCCNWDFR